MTTLPAPQLPNNPLPPTPDSELAGRLRTAAVALVASMLAIGSIAIGSQFVSASSPSLSTETPEDLEAEFAAWDDYDKCLSEQLGEQLGVDESVEHPSASSVTVDILSGDDSGDDFDLSIYDFGEDDGSITIVKDGDNISVTSQGDVTEIDDSSVDDLDPKFEAAHDACADRLPDGMDLGEIAPEPGESDIFNESPGE